MQKEARKALELGSLSNFVDLMKCCVSTKSRFKSSSVLIWTLKWWPHLYKSKIILELLGWSSIYRQLAMGVDLQLVLICRWEMVLIKFFLSLIPFCDRCFSSWEMILHILLKKREQRFLFSYYFLRILGMLTGLVVRYMGLFFLFSVEMLVKAGNG